MQQEHLDDTSDHSHITAESSLDCSTGHLERERHTASDTSAVSQMTAVTYSIYSMENHNLL